MSAEIERAAGILRRGGMVAFPTETVYGLGADATNLQAVRRVFFVKGRPATNPVIVHVADAEAAKRYATIWPVSAQKLTDEFWPGPLTVVLPKSDAIVTAATAGKKTVGLRAPDHPMALELLRSFNGAIIGPSANRSTRVSPTAAQHVIDELGSKIDLVLDGGACKVGIESTVVDLSGAHPAILRPGAISRFQLEAVIGPVTEFEGTVAAGVAAASPGMQPVHYAPATPTFRFDRKSVEQVAKWCVKNPNKTAVIVRVGAALPDDPIPLSLSLHHRQVTMPTQPPEYARRLYATLRQADQQSAEVIWLEIPANEPQWTAVRDRLLRASRILTD